MLALSGGFDLRTPTDDARTLVRRFPHAKLLVVPRVGHSVLTNDLTGCALHAVAGWLDDGRSARAPGGSRSSPASRRSRRTASTGRAGPKQTLGLADLTLHEAVATWMMTAAIGGEKTTVAGLTHGTVATSIAGITLDEYGVAPGVWVSGRLSLSLVPPPSFSGTLTVGGPRASAGEVSLAGGKLTGTLGGKPVRSSY